jgi:AraC-like DNA-binding protein
MSKQTDIIYQVYKPSSDLAHLVNYYFLYENNSKTIAEEFALSDGNPGISFALHQPYALESSDQEYVSASAAFICGAFTKGLYARNSSVPQKMFGVKFTIDGLYYLLQEQLNGLNVQPVWNAEIVVGNKIAMLTEQIREAADSFQRIHLLETFLRKYSSICELPDWKFRQVVSLIRQTNGQQQIEEIAKKVSLNYKWLERKFMQYTGTTPKEFSRLIRFTHTYFHYKRTGLTDVLDIAISNGFYDQNHFIKEFKHFTGYTPTKLQQTSIYDLASIMEPLSKVTN